ncbi:MAG: O-antigen ligase family protein, partial [Pyrinomonadaceae bacterium]
VAAAPHSIAVTQIGWLVGMLAWVLRLFVSPRSKVRISSIGIALAVLFVWSAISSVFSYEPTVSLDKLRAVSIFLIFIFALNVLRSRRAIHMVAFLLIGSCMVSVAWTPIQKLMGRGVEISQLSPESPLTQLGVRDGDVISRVNGRRVDSPAEVIERLAGRGSSALEMNRLDAVFRIDVDRAALIVADTPEAQLGFGAWTRWRGFRAAGFYGHFTTYAEVLQLIGALAFGLLVAALMWGGHIRPALALGVGVAGIGFALLLTVTRASQLAFMISSMSIVLLGASRKFILISVAIAVPIGGFGLYFLQQQRQVAFFDSKDGSIQWRQMMWRDGFRLLQESPRHLLVGVGMDSIKDRWEEWGFFDKGWQPMGHFHSTPIQLAVERGIPALLIWLIALGLYARTLWRALKRSVGSTSDWRSRGILLGCIGSLIGFFASGLVHYNLGDQEVAMVFFILMAFGVKLSELPPPDDLLLADAEILQPSA